MTLCGSAHRIRGSAWYVRRERGLVAQEHELVTKKEKGWKCYENEKILHMNDT